MSHILTFEQVIKLQPNQKIDFRDSNGKWKEAIVIQNQKDGLRLKINGIFENIHIPENVFRIAEHASVSMAKLERKEIQFKNILELDWIDVNLHWLKKLWPLQLQKQSNKTEDNKEENCFEILNDEFFISDKFSFNFFEESNFNEKNERQIFWRASQIRKIDKISAQIQVRIGNDLQNPHQVILFWVNMNDENEVSPHLTQSKYYMNSFDVIFEGINDENEEFRLQTHNNSNKNKNNLSSSKKKLLIVCSHCSKHFEYKSVLEKHINVHSDERLYKCNKNECEKSYKYFYSLKRHLNKRHGSKWDINRNRKKRKLN